MKYSVLYLLGLALPYVHFMFLVWVVFEIFTPIMGRSGTEIPPEVVLASLVTLTTVFLSSFFVSAPIAGSQGSCPVSSRSIHSSLSSPPAPLHLPGAQHKVDPGRSGLRLPRHVPPHFLRLALPVFRWPGQPAA